MEKVTIQLEEATVKALDRLMELRGCDLTTEAEVNVLVLASLGSRLCDMDDEFVGSELEEEMRATIKRLDPVTDKKARFEMAEREIKTLLILREIMEDEDAKNEIKQDVIDLINDLEAETEEEVEEKQRCIDLIKELD